MLRFCDRLLRVGNRCAVRTYGAHDSAQKRRPPSQIAKFKHRDPSAQNEQALPKSRFKSFPGESTLFDQVDPDELDRYDTFEDESFDDQILNAHLSYDEYEREEQQHNKAMVRNIIKRKYFKEPQEPNLLTWAAKEQLRYLHATDSEAWNSERLAESFPITVSGVKKLLASPYRIHSQDQMLAHDKAVYVRWKQLRKDGGPILMALHPRFSSGKPDLASARENSKLPVPDTAWQMQHLPQMTESTTPIHASVGEFESLIVQYKSLVKKPTSDSVEFTLASDQKEISKHSEPSGVMESFPAPPASLRDAKVQVTFDQLTQNMKKHLLKRSVDDPEVYQKFKTWLKDNDTSKVLPQPPPMEELLEDPMVEFFEGKVKQYKDVEGPGVTWDVHRDAKHPEAEEAYIYDPECGYQRPYGRFEGEDRIHIPRSEWKKDALYRRGDCYYDDTSEFLYRVPFPQE